jgi:hypothetical protein
MRVRPARELKLSIGARRAFRELDEEIAGRVATHLDAIAERGRSSGSVLAGY